MRKYAEAENIQLVFSGSNYFDTLERIIDESRYILHLQTYIFNTDETGFRVMDALKRAARRNVRVFLMVDAYASFPFPKDLADDLRQAGVHFRLYSPLLTSESMFIGRRMHHKVVVADKRTGMLGGINIANKYNSGVTDKTWLDFAVLITGDVCEYLHLLCEQFYKKQNPRALNAWEKNFSHALSKINTHKYVRFRRNDWLKRKNEIHKSYLEAIIRSESSITLVASYFLPGNNIRRLLREAAARGVEIRVIVAGVSDIGSLRLAENYLHDFYIRHGIRVFEWTDSVMHGKAMIVDRTWATIGSYNLNFLSHYVSIELNADVIDPQFVDSFSDHLSYLITHNCRPVDLKSRAKNNNPVLRFVRWLAYNFYRIMMMLALRGKKYREKKSKE